jgi:hypothetical protein
MRDDDELPSGRLLLIMEAHERLKERKRKGVRAQVSTEPSPALEPKPRLEQAIMPKPSRAPLGKDYAEVMRRIGRPASPGEIAQRAGVTMPSVMTWLNRWGPDAGVQIVGRRKNSHGRPSHLYAIVEST